MKLLNISIIMSCNKRCYYCPVSKWLRPVDNKFSDEPPTPPYPFNGTNCINNDALLKWLDRFIKPEEWIVEITGGEPGLYNGIDTLIPALNDRGYQGFIKTNGSLPIPKTDNFQRIASWHEGQDFPLYYDQILIIRNPNEDYRKKIKYCKENGVPYKTSKFDSHYLTGAPNDTSLINPTVFTHITHINNMGQLVPCPALLPDLHKSIFHMIEPELKQLAGSCPRCYVAVGIDPFLTEEQIKMIKAPIEREPDSIVYV